MFPQDQGDRIFLKDSTPEPGFPENIDESPPQSRSVRISGDGDLQTGWQRSMY